MILLKDILHAQITHVQAKSIFFWTGKQKWFETTHMRVVGVNMM